MLPILLSALAAADEAPKAPAKPWTEKASLSFVSTSGNAEGSTLGFANEFLYKWKASQLQFNLAAVRINTTTVVRSAQGASLSDFAVTETRTTRTTSANYLANLRYDHKITEHFFWFAAAGWERNLPAGLDSRAKVSAGLGRIWANGPATKFRTDLGFGSTREHPVFVPAGFQESFGTWNFNAKLERKLGATSSFVSEFGLASSLQSPADRVAVWKNALSSSLNNHFALKVGLDFSHRNRPASVGVDLVQTGSNPPVILGQVPFRLKNLDSAFTTSLVLTF